MSILKLKSRHGWLLATALGLVLLLAAGCANESPSQAALAEANQPELGTASSPGAPLGGDSPGQSPAPFEGWELSPRVDSVGAVAIEVTPHLDNEGGIWAFDVALNTHSVSLDEDLTQVALLRCDLGNEYSPLAWDGSGPGGHHRSGVLTFDALDHPISSIDVIVQDVGGVSERVFRWESPQAGIRAIESAPRTSPAPKIAFDAETIDLGNIPVDKAHPVSFVFRNAGDASLVITGRDMATIEGC